MARPVILSVDDDPQVLASIERDLRDHYADDYRVLTAQSGAEAVETLTELARRGTAVALLLVDQRMPGMEGTELLAASLSIVPDAKRVLLTAYADTQAAIDAINRVRLDHYLMKPWDPPEEHLYPILDDLLGDWVSHAQPPYDGIRVAGTLWSSTSHDVKDFLARNRIPYQWLDIEKDEQARQMVEHAEGGGHSLPVVFFPDGTIAVEPSTRDLAEKVGLQTQATHPFYDVIIIGGGPAGLGAGVYAATEGLHAAMIEREATGGQAGTSSRIENYLGFPNGISGADLAQRATAQAMRFGCEILTTQEAANVRVEGPYRVVTLKDGTELTAHAVVIATGVSVKELEAPGVKELTGIGVYYGAAVSEAAHYKDEDVFVIGGANSAGQGAIFLSRYANSVTILIRGPRIEDSMSQYLVDQIGATPNIRVMTDREVVSVEGDGRLEATIVGNPSTGETERLEGRAMFVFIGAEPHTGLVAGLVAVNEHGFIITGPDLMHDGERPKGWTLNRDPYPLESSVPGIFAAGDVRQGVIRRVASAVGEGAIGISLVHRYLQTV